MSSDSSAVQADLHLDAHQPSPLGDLDCSLSETQVNQINSCLGFSELQLSELDIMMPLAQHFYRV
jgi:hypothetical protein